jgi:hypothetical protein
MNEPVKNGTLGEQFVPTEQQILQVLAENSRWIDQNENRLLAEHPEYWGKYAMIASRCPQPLLAVDEDHDIAYQRAVSSEELHRVVAAEKLPADLLITRYFMGDDW